MRNFLKALVYMMPVTALVGLLVSASSIMKGSHWLWTVRVSISGISLILWLFFVKAYEEYVKAEQRYHERCIIPKDIVSIEQKEILRLKKNEQARKRYAEASPEKKKELSAKRKKKTEV